MASFTPPKGHKTFLKSPDTIRCRRYVDDLAQTIVAVREGRAAVEDLAFFAEMAHIHIGHLEAEDAITALISHYNYYRAPVNVPMADARTDDSLELEVA